MGDASDQGRRNDEPVGYGRPPRHTRWQKGQSGNPNGRRRSVQDVRGLGEMAMEHLARPQKVKIDGKVEVMAALDTVILRGLKLALTAQRVLDVTRYLEVIARLGFQYPFAAGAARKEQRDLFDTELAERDAQLEVTHAMLREYAETLAEANAELARYKQSAGQLPDDGSASPD